MLAGLAQGPTLCPALCQNQSKPSSPAPSRRRCHPIMSVLGCRARERECTATRGWVSYIKGQRITSSGVYWIIMVPTVTVCRKTPSHKNLFPVPSLFVFPGWSPYLPAAERVSNKSSSKPRARLLSGPVSLSICLYLSLTQTKLISPVFHFALYLYYFPFPYINTVCLVRYSLLFV